MPLVYLLRHRIMVLLIGFRFAYMKQIPKVTTD